MLIDAAAALVMRCARCGKLVLISESLFNLRRAVKEVNCPCGGSLARLYLGRGGVLKLEIMCFICEDWHSVTLPLASFLRGMWNILPAPRAVWNWALPGPPTFCGRGWLPAI